MRLPSSKHRRKRAVRGAAMVEGAFVFSVLLLILMAMVDWGLAALSFNTVSDASRRLAREAIVHGEKAAPRRAVWGPGAYAGTADDDSPYAAAIRPFLTPMDPRHVEIRMDWPDGGNRVNQRVRVTLTCRYRATIPFVPGAAERSLSAVSTMRIAH